MSMGTTYGIGCCACGTMPPPACSTTITVVLLPLPGGGSFHPGPGDIFYAIDGTTADGKAIHLGGRASPTIGATRATFALSYSATTLPEGAYHLHVYDQGTTCGQAYGPTGRFDGSLDFTVKCPRTTVELDIPAAFDVLAAQSRFQLQGCAPSDAPGGPLVVAASVSGPGSICSQATAGSGTAANNLAATVKATGYPVDIRFDGTAANYLPADETITFRLDDPNGFFGTSDWRSTPRLVHQLYRIAATSQPQDPNFPYRLTRGGVTVVASGYLTGTGTTNGYGEPIATMTLSTFQQDKVGTDPTLQVLTWTMSAPGCSTVTYSWDPSNGLSNQQTATLCPMGGHIDCGGYDGYGSARAARPAMAFAVARRSASPDGRVRVGMVAPCLYRGGGETHQLTLIRGTGDRLAWQGVAVVADERSYEPSTLEETRKLTPVAFGWGAARALAERCDVLVSWLPEDLAPTLAGIEPRPRVLFVDHFPHDRPATGPMLDVLRSADHLVGVSELCVPGFPPGFADRSSVIWHAVDPARLERTKSRRGMLRSWGVPREAIVAGYMSRLDPRRGPDAMIRLVESLPPPWHVVVVGDPGPYLEYKASLDARIAALPADARDRLHLLPPAPNVADVLGAFDVLVAPVRSDGESWGYTVAEGILANVPVVTTPTGLGKLMPGLTTVVPFDPDGPTLARAVRSAWAGGTPPELRDELRRRADPARFAREWADLIERMAGTRKPSLAARAVALARAVVTHAAAGFPIAPPGDRDRRALACAACPELLPPDTCARCGCNLTAKRAMATEHCPLGQW